MKPNFLKLIYLILILFSTHVFAALDEDQEEFKKINEILITQFNKISVILDRNSEAVSAILGPNRPLTFEKLFAIQWSLNPKNGYFCNNEPFRCFAVSFSPGEKYEHGAIILNKIALQQERDNETILIGLLHEGLGALFGPIDLEYEKSLLLWYLNYLKENNQIEAISNLVQMQNIRAIKLADGGISTVGGGDLSSIRFKKSLLINSELFFNKSVNGKKIQSCDKLINLQNTILKIRVTINPLPNNMVVNVAQAESADLNLREDILYISPFTSAFMDYNSSYGEEILFKFLYERGCHEPKY